MVPPSASGGGAVLGPTIQPFDPYSGSSQAPGNFVTPPNFGGQAASVPPSLPPFNNGAAGLPPPPASNPLPGPPTYPTFPNAPYGPPAANIPPSLPPAFNTGPPPPLNGPAPMGPGSAIFPNGLPWNQGAGSISRLIQDTGFDWGWLNGDTGDELQIHEVNVSTSLVLQNFAHTAEGLRVTPGVAFSFLDGPNVPMGTGADLPSALYGAYIDALWQPQITPQFYADLNLRTGVYSDFNSVTNDSLRFIGRGLGVWQLTPQLAFKLGVEYLDRLHVKLLPAGGVLWEPDPQTRFDIYFPRPKLSRYWTTYGNNEIWWYVRGEYGGGNWTIERLDAPLVGASDRVDINDIRIALGVDWQYLDRYNGFFEVGYVFDREIRYELVPAENTAIDDTFMLRGGVRF